MKYLIYLVVIVSIFSGSVMAKDHKNKGLPPGLQKKVERNQSLPPGWQKKLQKGTSLDPAVYEQGTVRPVGDRYEEVYIEDKVIKVIKKTREIIDIITKWLDALIGIDQQKVFYNNCL